MKTETAIRDWFAGRRLTWILWVLFWTPLILVIFSVELTLRAFAGALEGVVEAWDEYEFGDWFIGFTHNGWLRIKP